MRITPAHAGKSLQSAGHGSRHQDHPRTCGEKPMGFWVCPPIEGSPPHMRGKGTALGCKAAGTGITPAHAGKRTYSPTVFCRFWDHPRTCGEKWKSAAHLRRGNGITPAHAGKSPHFCPREREVRDHPRTCGEKAQREGCTMWHRGSPPHMRGKEAAPHRQHVRQRITPAHAGKRPWPALSVPGSGDHPRTCGEKGDLVSQGGNILGSPPHMRGKVTHAYNLPYWYGITPAHAGKSCRPWPYTTRCKDHPRTCGEKHGGWPGKRGRVRITPAHAGKSDWRDHRPYHRQDHPRTCGEKSLAAFGKPRVGGSPPHMRGKVAGIPSMMVISGITPAHAGKSRFASD